MSEDSYWTQGAIKDRAQSLAVQTRIAVALEKIATSLESEMMAVPEGMDEDKITVDWDKDSEGVWTGRTNTSYRVVDLQELEDGSWEWRGYDPKPGLVEPDRIKDGYVTVADAMRDAETWMVGGKFIVEATFTDADDEAKGRVMDWLSHTALPTDIRSDLSRLLG